MAFEHVKMGPVEEAFVRWSEAKAKAEAVARAVENMDRRGDGAKPYVNISAGLKTESCGVGNYDDWLAVAAALAAILCEDLAGNIRAASAALQAEAERLRCAFLRASLEALAGGDVPTDDDSDDA